MFNLFNYLYLIYVDQHLTTFLMPVAILIWYCEMARRQMKHVSCSFRHKSILKFRPYLQATHHSYVSRFFLDECLQLLWITKVKIQINVLNKISRNLGSNFLYEFAIFQQQQFGILTSNFPEFNAYNQDRPSRISR